MIVELERACSAGIGLIAARVFAKAFTQDDLASVIRFGLIGGGTDPKRAAELIAAYVTGRPLAETYPIASGILEYAWFGEPHEGKSNGEA